MRINPISTNIYNNKTSFKSLVFHDGAQNLIKEDGNTLDIQKSVADYDAEARKYLASNKLKRTEKWDLHVKPVDEMNVTFFWTRQGQEEPVFERYVYPYKRIKSEDKNELRFSAGNPDKSDLEKYKEFILKYANAEIAQKAYDVMNREAEEPIERLEKFVDVTLALEAADKFNQSYFD